jgi:DNA-binding NtrC family response regulator
MGTEAIEIDTGVASRTTSRRHVLMVHDAAAERERVANYLTLNDLRATPAENGKRMMEILRDEVIDLVALELKLRGEEGQQLAGAQWRTAMSAPRALKASQGPDL